MSGTTAAALNVAPKGPKIAVKSGFVIPKNKLSGSLVPAFGAKKQAAADLADKESAKQGQRKTKWGPDPTQDPDVKKGRALAYQTRVDQITKLLISGTLDIGNDEDLSSAAQALDHSTPKHQIDSNALEALELEKREAIGEILKINPSYKAPPDYKPLLKEARVPVPVKEYPGYNFIGLIFGPGSDNQKRFEKETGAKIQVYGIKEETGEKVEIFPSDGNKVQCAYDELYVQISADTFDKVDKAASLIEMLVTSVMGNLAAVSTSSSATLDKANPSSQVIDATATSMVSAAVNQDFVHPMGIPQTPFQGQFQYPVNWFQSQSNIPMTSPSGFAVSSNAVLPVLNNPSNSSTSEYMATFLGPRPTPATPYNPLPQQPPAQPMQQSYLPQPNPRAHSGAPANIHMPVIQPLSAQLNVPVPLPYTSSQTPPTGPSAGLFFSPYHQQTVRPRPLHGQQLPFGGNSGWPGGHIASPVPSGVSTFRPLAPAAAPSQGPHPVGVYSNVASAPPAPAMVSPQALPTGPSTQQISGMSINRFPNVTSGLSSTPAAAQTGFSSALSAPSASLRPVSESVSVSTSMSLGNFTFNPHLSQNGISQRAPMLSGQHPSHNPHGTQLLRSPVPQSPSVQMAAPNPAPPFMQRPRSQAGQMLHPQFHAATEPRFGNPSSELIPSRFPADPNAGFFAPRTSVLHAGPRDFGSASQMQNLGRPFMPAPSSQNWQNFQATARPQIFHGQQFSTRPFTPAQASANPGGQTYDPFSPTSVSVAGQLPGSNMGSVRRQESDPEYEDLMASVGVK